MSLSCSTHEKPSVTNLRQCYAGKTGRETGSSPPPLRPCIGAALKPVAAARERHLPAPVRRLLTVVPRTEWNSRFVAAVRLLDRSADDAEIGRLAEAAFPSAGLLVPEEAACSYLAMAERRSEGTD